MHFFYFSNLGAIYFYTLTAICAFALLRGGRDYKIFSFCMIFVFLSDRTLLATMNDEATMITLGGIAELLALIAVLTLVPIGRAARFIAFLFAAKIAFYISLIAGAIGFETMAAWTELAGYGQLLIILTGTIHHETRGKLAVHPVSVFPGNGGLRFVGKKGFQDE